MRVRKILCTLVVLQYTVSFAQAAAMDDLNTTLRNFAVALALMMFFFQALRWVMADSPQARAEAKKGIIYIILGLLVVYLAFHVVCGIYGYVLRNYGVTCTPNAATFTCDC